MVDMIQDMTDIFAREHTPLVVGIIEKIVDSPDHGFTTKQRQDIKEMLKYLKNFDGKMVEDSVSASVYSYW